MKVALVSYDTFQGKTTSLYPPIHLLHLATSLRKHDYEVKVFDYAGPFESMDSYFKEIQGFDPQIASCAVRPQMIGHRLPKSFRMF